MKRFLLAASMFSVWLAIASTYYVCVIKGMCGESEVKSTVIQTPKESKPNIIKNEPITTSVEEIKDTLTIVEQTISTVDTLKSTGLNVYDNDYLLKSYFGNFKIYKNTPQVTIAFSISEYGYLIAKHMDSVDSALLVKGYHNQEETNEQGLQRANFIKERLIKLGIPENLITTESQSAIYEYNKNKFVGGIEFNFKKTDSTISLNEIDYSRFNDLKEVTIINNPKEIIKEEVVINEPKPIISEAEITAITKSKTKDTYKKPTIPQIKTENASFTVTEKYFKNNKFKVSKKFRNFIETHKESQNLKLVGYSNANENTNENYNKGLELVNLVKTHLLNEVGYSGKTTTKALKNQNFSSESTIKEGVTLIIH